MDARIREEDAPGLRQDDGENLTDNNIRPPSESGETPLLGQAVQIMPPDTTRPTAEGEGTSSPGSSEEDAASCGSNNEPTDGGETSTPVHTLQMMPYDPTWFVDVEESSLSSLSSTSSSSRQTVESLPYLMTGPAATDSAPSSSSEEPFVPDVINGAPNGQGPSSSEHQCQICLQYFPRDDGLRRHKETHTQEPQYQCQLCLQCFPQYSNLLVHMRMHTVEHS